MEPILIAVSKPFFSDSLNKRFFPMSNYKQDSLHQCLNSDILSAPNTMFSMQPAEFIQDDLRESTTTLKRKKYCRQCWREDLHYRVNYSPVVFGFLIVATLGLVLLIRPSRCVCCGTMRIN